MTMILPGASAQEPCCPVVELRQYTLKPGARETLVALFDGEFLETQEALGMQVIAQFRDLDRPDMFVWLRGFADMPARARALEAFYGGPVWKAHGPAANATMIDSDNVLLLRPARAGGGYPLGERAPAGATAVPPGLVVATIYTLHRPAAGAFSEFFETRLSPRLVGGGARVVAAFETEPAPNSFPRLSVREGEQVFVGLALFADLAVYERSMAALAADPEWTETVRPALDTLLAAPPQVLRLTFTARSRH